MPESRRQASEERSLTERAREYKELEKAINRLEYKLRINKQERTRLQTLISLKKNELRLKRALQCHPRTKVREHNVASLGVMHGCHFFCYLCGYYIVQLQGAYKGEGALPKEKSQTAVSNSYAVSLLWRPVSFCYCYGYWYRIYRMYVKEEALRRQKKEAHKWVILIATHDLSFHFGWRLWHPWVFYCCDYVI